jgi:hypothetical protein
MASLMSEMRSIAGSAEGSELTHSFFRYTTLRLTRPLSPKVPFNSDVLLWKLVGNEFLEQVLGRFWERQCSDDALDSLLGVFLGFLDPRNPSLVLKAFPYVLLQSTVQGKNGVRRAICNSRHHQLSK